MSKIMLFLLYGQDTYRLHHRLSEIIKELKKSSKDGLSLNVINGGKDKTSDGFNGYSFRNFLDGFQQRSIFEKGKLLVLKNFFFNQDFKEKFLKDFEKFLGDNNNIIFYQEGKVLKGDPLFKSLKKEGKIEEFDFLKDSECKKWIKDNFKELKISDEALDQLITSVGNDLWRMSNEIEKLLNFKKERIELMDVEVMVESRTEAGIFKTIDAIARGDKKGALKLIHDHLKKGDSPFYLLSMINYQFRNIINVKDMLERKKNYGSIIKETGLHPYVAKKTLAFAKKISMDDLKKIYRRIFQADLSIKTGKIEAEAALDFLISAI